MRKLLFIAVIGGLATAQVGLAEDLQPPPWRGQYSTTSQVWEFNDSALVQPGTVILPDGPAPGGMPPLSSTQLIWTPGPTAPWNEWLSQDMPNEYPVGSGNMVGIGVVPLSGKLDITVDNHNPPNEVKYVVMQLTWRAQDVGEEPILDLLEPPPFGDVKITPIQLGTEWWEWTYEWEIRPNPPDEHIIISGTINVDELVIDTWCIPEPASAMLLVAGGAALLRRRRR